MDHNLNNPDAHALEVNITTGGSKIAIVGIYRSPGSKPAEDDKLSIFLGVVAGSAGKFLKLGDFHTPEIDLVCRASPEDNFEHQILRFVHLNMMVR